MARQTDMHREQTDTRPDAPAGAQPSGDQPMRRRMDYRPTGADASPKLLPTLKRTLLEFREDNMSDWAAALTYYGLLSLFPALIALTAIIGVFGDPQATTRTITQIVRGIGPHAAVSAFEGPVRSITTHRATSLVLLVLGLATALWSASGYVGAFMRAANVAYETPEGRPFWKLRPLQIGVTLAMVLMLALVLISFVLTGPIVGAVGNAIGVGGTIQTLWQILKWPILLVVVLLMFAVLFHAAPNVEQRGFRWVTPGALLAIAVWIVASAGFAFYVGAFGSYNKTYGALGGVIVLLVWMWITNSAVLLGLELNAERERSAELREGQPGASRELQRDARDAPKRERTT